MVNILEGNTAIQLIGLADPDFTVKSDLLNEVKAMVNTKLQNMVSTEASYRILLSHRPELIDVYEKNSINLVLVGMPMVDSWIPFIGGLIAPDQTFQIYRGLV